MRAVGFLPAAGDHRKQVKSSEPEASSSPPAASRASANRFLAAAAASAGASGAEPRWSCAPARSAASVESAMQLTQWPWPSSVRTSLPWSCAAHTLHVRSCEPVKSRPSPPQRTQLTDDTCPCSENRQRPLTRSHTRAVPSLEAEQKRPCSGSACSGSHASALTHFLCALITRTGATCGGAHTDTMPSLPPEMRKRLHADQAMHSTQSLCALSVALGSSVRASHRRTVWSPEPVASIEPSALKLVDSIASACPGSVAVHRATARTRKTACGT
mmetsp:Transcript_35290/g.89579  ORF Transcript_35290/g.89579 Transcript_35290/m.89579 type:complete len:272 (-) Transcript_35290:485-1300(-)